MHSTDAAGKPPAETTAHHAAQAYDAVASETELIVTAPTRLILSRADTHAAPVLTVRLSSPLPDVIRVSIEHFAGASARGPRLPLSAENLKPRIRIDTTQAVLESEALAARLDRTGGWDLAFHAGERVLTRSGFQATGFSTLADGSTVMHAALSLAAGETILGLGERDGPVVRNGHTVENIPSAAGVGGTSQPSPFYLSSRGYGVLVDEYGPVTFEVGHGPDGQVRFSAAGERLDFLLIHGPSPKDVLRRLSTLTGRPALPPAWSFGLWLGTSADGPCDETVVNHLVEGMRARDLPAHVFLFGPSWMRAYAWGGFEWDSRAFPDSIGLMRRLHARGLKICVSIGPYVGPFAPTFAGARAGGYLVRRPGGAPAQTDERQPGGALVDFTHPGARAWYAGHLRELLETGVDCFETELGDAIPGGLIWHDGSEPERMRAFFPVLYQQTVFDEVMERRGDGDAVILARGSTLSGQRYPVQKVGHSSATYDSMAAVLRAGLAASTSGVAFWTHDIGGFEGRPTAALYKRWIPFGLLSSHSLLHGKESYRVPWDFDTEAVDVLRQFTRLKCRLMPYLFGAAVEAHREGIPMLRAMALEFPHDPACAALDQQYMLGASLLVAPIFTEDGVVDVYLPRGRWTHLLTGEVVEGGTCRREQHGFSSLPLYVREGTALAVGTRDDRPDYEFTDGVLLRVFTLADGATAETVVPKLEGRDGARFRARRRGRQIEITRSGSAAPSPWQVQLAGIGEASITGVEGGTARNDSLGVIVKIDARTNSVLLMLAATP